MSRDDIFSIFPSSLSLFPSPLSLFPLSLSQAAVQDVTFSPSGEFFASVGADEQVSRTCTGHITGKYGSILSIAID